MTCNCSDQMCDCEERRRKAGIVTGQEEKESELKLCKYCGGYHKQMCFRIAEIEYFEDGRIRRIQFR